MIQHARELYQHILGITSRWRVENIHLSFADRQVAVAYGIVPEQVWCCRACCRNCGRHDHRRRSWRHLDMCQFQTVIEADVTTGQLPSSHAEHSTAPGILVHSMHAREGLDCRRRLLSRAQPGQQRSKKGQPHIHCVNMRVSFCFPRIFTVSICGCPLFSICGCPLFSHVPP